MNDLFVLLTDVKLSKSLLSHGIASLLNEAVRRETDRLI